jgi:hypothetical protein
MAVWSKQRRSAISMQRIGPANGCTDTTDLVSVAMESPKAQPWLRQGRIAGYASAAAYFGHAVGESNPDLQARITAGEGFGGPGIIVPTRNSELFG